MQKKKYITIFLLCSAQLFSIYLIVLQNNAELYMTKIYIVDLCIYNSAELSIYIVKYNIYFLNIYLTLHNICVYFNIICMYIKGPKRAR